MTDRKGREGYHDPFAGVGGAAPARSALTLRIVLAGFGLLVCSVGAVVLWVAEAPAGFPLTAALPRGPTEVTLKHELMRRRGLARPAPGRAQARGEIVRESWRSIVNDHVLDWVGICIVGIYPIVVLGTAQGPTRTWSGHWIKAGRASCAQLS